MNPDPPRSGSQRIPRPAEVRPGGPAPWAGLLPEQRRVTLAAVRQAVSSRPIRPVRPEGRPGQPSSVAAVLMPFYVDREELHVILTRRAQHLRAHRGEVSFPGGRLEPGEQPVDAARREAREEIGLDPDEVEVVGELDMISTASSGSSIVPLVSILPRRPDLAANPSEVEAILLVPVATLLADGVFREEQWPIGSTLRPIYFFEIPGDTIWGATARLLHQFFALALPT